MIKIKQCTKCNEIKSLSEFHKCNANKDGYQYTCKQCRSFYNRTRYQNNKEYIKNQCRIYKENHKEEKKEKDKIFSKQYYLNDNNKIQHNNSIENLKKERYFISLRVYGNKCQECGHNNIIHLEFHHKIGGMNEKHDALLKRISIYGKQNDIELLCANCHINADIRDKTNNKGSFLLKYYNEWLQYNLTKDGF